jgi:hypothetical protein
LAIAPAAPGQTRGRTPRDGARSLQVPRALPTDEELKNVRIDPRFLRITSRLDSDSYAAREAALLQLVEGSITLEQLCAILAREPLSTEQRFRLLGVVREKLVGTPRGALGISMNMRVADDRDPGGIEIVDLIEGLPAEKVLRLNDRITHIDGHRLTSRNDLVILVQSKKPGEHVALKVSRPRRDDRGRLARDERGLVVFDAIDVDLELGSLDALRDPETGVLSTSVLLGDMRMNEAADATQRYAPRPRRVRIRDDKSGAFTGRSARWEFTAEAVESHRVIQSVQRDLQRIASGRMQRTAELEAGWQQQLKGLYDLAEDDDLSEQEVDFVRRVIARLKELMGS